ncbi:MAG: hypothetical protein V4804_10050 [Pseudomonadota bacterium]
MNFTTQTGMRHLVRISAVALLLSSTAAGIYAVAPAFDGAAFAQDDGDGEGGQGQGGQGDGGNGQGGQGSQQGQGNQGGTGEGQGGPSADSDGKGPQAGGPSDSGGGKPVWAQEGIPEVELGRLSVARSPDQVLDRALAEALSNISPDIVSFYNLSLEDAITTLSLEFDTVTMYDSPLQSLSLLRDALDGSSVLADYGVTNDIDTLMALFIGVASDKTIPVSTDTVIALTTIFGEPMTEAEAAALAAAAEAVRVAVLAGHG